MEQKAHNDIQQARYKCTTSTNINCAQIPERNKLLRILCERILMGKQMRKRKSLQLLIHMQSQLTVHTFVKKATWFRIVFKISPNRFGY